MRRTTIALILCILLCLPVFASCGKSGDATATTAAQNATDPAVTETETADVTTAEATTDKWEEIAEKVTMITQKDRSLKIACDISRNGVKTSKNNIYVAGPDSVEDGITPEIEVMVFERNKAAKNLLDLTIEYDYWTQYYGQQVDKIDVLVKGNADDAPDLKLTFFAVDDSRSRILTQRQFTFRSHVGVTKECKSNIFVVVACLRV